MLSLVPSKAANTSITFWNMEMLLDDVNNYEGVRLVSFFLPTCPSCINELDVLKELEQNYSITIFELDAQKQSTNQTLIDFKGDHSLPDEWVLGYSTDESEIYFEIDRVPSIVILDDNGDVAAVIKGSASYNTLSEKIEDAIHKRTTNYPTNYSNTNKRSDNMLLAFAIILGVGITVVVGYFVVKGFISKS